MEKSPKIYAFTIADKQYKGWIKIGETDADIDERVKQQFPTFPRGKEPYDIIIRESRIKDDGSIFSDKDVHEHLVNMGFKKKQEWIKCTKKEAESAIMAVKYNMTNEELRNKDFAMRPEQERAVKITAEYFRDLEGEKEPKFLWNAKMRFGKTFTTYQLAKEMGWKNILILTFKPAVEGAWQQDATEHVAFDGWQYISSNSKNNIKDLDKNKPIVCFGSFQDYLGRGSDGRIKEKNEWVHEKNWDCIVFDEYHFGAWREKAKKLTESDPEVDLDIDFEDKQPDEIDIEEIPITAYHFLYLSGTPFRAIASGEFTQENIYNWSYYDEQREKRNWDESKKGNNPYEDLPQMKILTYDMPEEIKKVARDTVFDEFDLNGFFSVKDGKFEEEMHVKNWLKLIREGNPATKENLVKELKIKSDNPNDNKYQGKSYIDILNSLSHTLWYLPSVDSCYAMKELLEQDSLYSEYEIVLVAGKAGGTGAKAKIPADEAMNKDGKSPLETKTIILTCGKLTTGVTLAPLSGVYMLRNLNSTETYFQTAFRAQNQWVGKKECYIIDFAPNRALKQIVNYVEKDIMDSSSKTSLNKKLGEFINFLPIISYKGGRIEELDVEDIKNIAMAGSTDKYITKVWQNSDLINLEKNIVEEIRNDPAALEILRKMKAFKSGGSDDIDIIIKKTEEIKNMKREGKPENEISRAENELKKAKKLIEEKIKGIVARLPLFMYLTDKREKELEDIINDADPELFRMVTGIDNDDLRILTKLGVFNKATMDIAISDFKKYEDRSFDYFNEYAKTSD